MAGAERRTDGQGQWAALSVSRPADTTQSIWLKLGMAARVGRGNKTAPAHPLEPTIYSSSRSPGRPSRPESDQDDNNASAGPQSDWH